MSDKKFTTADSTEISKRADLLEKFINLVFDEEDRPYLISDKASLYDITCGDENKIIERIKESFDVLITEEYFHLPVWELLDFISSKEEGCRH